jgi:anti-sigma B factor antagonist
VAVLYLQGHLDALTVSELKQEVSAVISEKITSSVVDLAGVTLIDSSGVGSLIAFFKRLRSVGGDVKISGLAAQPKEIFRLLGLERAFDILPTVEEALAKFQA